MSNSQLCISSWASNITPSLTLAVDAKAKALKAAGEDVCGFGAGEPNFDTPEFIKEACKKAIDDGKTKYCPAAGLLELRTLLAQKFVRDNNVPHVTSSQVVVSPGGKFSCYLAILAVCNPGDEVIIPSPYWVSYPEMVGLAGAVPKVVEATSQNDLKVTVDQLKEAVTAKTKLLILNSPSNPTGVVYTRKELEDIVEFALSKNLYIMSDEIYEYLLYDGVEHFSPASFSKEAAEATITVGGFSKTFSVTGWRLGTLMANEKVAKAVAGLQSHTTSNATTFAQYGALAAMQRWDESKGAMAGMIVEFDKRRVKMLDFLNSIKGMSCMRSQGAFYLFPNISSYGLSSNDFATKLLEDQKVAVVPGVAFGAEGYLRMSYATSDAVIDKGLGRLKAFCEGL